MIERLQAVLTNFRRRSVYRAAAAYVIVGLGVIGAAELILGPLGFEYLLRPVVLLTLVGFPFIVIFAWIHDLRNRSDDTGPQANGLSSSLLPQTYRLDSSEHDRIDGASVTEADSAAQTQQQVRFCQTADQVRIAYSIIGSGPPLVRVLGWFTHLEMEWQWPQLRFFWESLAEYFTVIRYDGRGIGLSDPWHEEFTEETRLLDLEAVVTASGFESVSLLAISEGGWTAALYANQASDRVDQLVFYGCYSRGLSARPDFDPEENEALVTLMRKGWGRSEPTLRRLFTNDFFPMNANPDLLAHFDELQRISADSDTAVRYVESLHERRGDGREIFEKVSTPSLVLHRQGDRVVSLEEGRRLAALIPGANLQVLRGNDHYFPIDHDSAKTAVKSISQFVSGSDASEPSR